MEKNILQYWLETSASPPISQKNKAERLLL